MTVSRKLPPGFAWRHELDQDTLYYDNVPVARVEPLVHGTVVRSLVRGPHLSSCETLVANVDRGIALATRWATERQGPIHEACESAHRTATGNDQAPESPSIARWFQT